MSIITILTVPFFGTVLGAACVFFMKDNLSPSVEKTLLGFAGGVMVAASVWSLIIPAVEQCSSLGKFASFPAAAGIFIGMSFLFILDKAVPHLHLNADKPEGPSSKLKRTTMLVLAVTLHNIPEGMAVGVVAAAVMNGTGGMSWAGAAALAAGIAVQNFPEGAVISLPLKNEGFTRKRAFLYGSLSGIVEPVAAVLTVLLSFIVIPALPLLLSFAAGAMLFVVVEELIPEASRGEHSDNGTVGFSVGFILMMILDVAFG